MSIKILATADLHLGKSSSSVPGQAEEASTKYTWMRIIEWAVKNDVDILILCGDIVDQDNRYFEAIGPLQSGFYKLKEAGIAVYLVTGNHDHDVLSQITHDNKYDHIHLLGFNGKWEVATFLKGHQSIQLVGWSFPRQFVTEDPLITFKEVSIDPNHPTIGLLHGDLDNRESKYGPIELNSLLSTNVNAWILGHIHKPQEIRKHGPSIWYPGSPHAMSGKEPGIHGPIVLIVEDANDIKISTLPLSPVRYENIFIDVTDATDEAKLRDIMISTLITTANDIIEELEDVAFMVYDVCLIGRHSNIKEVGAWAQNLHEYDQEIKSGTRIIVGKVIINLRPAIQNLEDLAKQPSPAGILAATILAVENGNFTPFLSELLKHWNQKHEAISNSVTYQPLRISGRLDNKDQKEAKDYILLECNRLLGELIDQQG